MRKSAVLLGLVLAVAVVWAAELKPEHKKICEQVRQLQRADGLFKAASGGASASAAETAGRFEDFLDLFTVLSHYHGGDFAAMRKALATFADALDGSQRANGLWGAVPDDPTSKDDPAASARIALQCAKGMHQKIPCSNNYLLDWGFLGVAEKTLAGLEQKGTAAPDVEKLRAEVAAARQADIRGFSKRLTPTQRAAAGQVAAIGELRLEPTYENISVAWGAPREFKGGVEMSFRRVGESAWRAASAPIYFRPNHNYRGSIMKLVEDTDYDVRLVAEGKTVASGTVRTWKTDVPVAETVELDAAAATYPIVIDRKGRPEGWIRYVPKGGKTFVNDSYAHTFVITNAAYVILDGFTVVGGRSVSPVLVGGVSVGVRILNWEMSGWGPGGPPNWARRGLCFEGDQCVQCGAIVLDDSPREVTIERCFIHSPCGRAHSWRYSHPFGPAAVQAYRPVSAVIRWCDFVGCDSRRFEDCIKSTKNDGYDKGLGRNSDVCGCFLFGANDDCAELDGGQQNVRFYGNRCEEALMGVSLQCNMTGPSYVYDNCFTGLGTEFGHRIAPIKVSSFDAFGYGSASVVAGNAFCGLRRDTRGFDSDRLPPTARLSVGENDAETPADVDLWPRRPIPWRLSPARFDVTRAAGRLSREHASFKLTCPQTATPYRAHFRVRTTELDHDWFDISPKEGMIESGKDIVFTVRFVNENLDGRRRYAAAALVRTDDGLSRPVTLHASTDHVGPFKVENPQGIVVYGAKGAEWSFDLPKDGTYYLFVRGRHPTVSGNSFMPQETAMTVTFDGE